MNLSPGGWGTKKAGAPYVRVTLFDALPLAVLLASRQEGLVRRSFRPKRWRREEVFASSTLPAVRSGTVGLGTVTPASVRLLTAVGTGYELGISLKRGVSVLEP